MSVHQLLCPQAGAQPTIHIGWVYSWLHHTQALPAPCPAEGWLEEHGPFDVIHCGAAALEIPPALTAALAPGGRLLIPVGPPRTQQRLTVIDRDRTTGQLLPVQREPATVGFGVLTPPASQVHPW
jgi:hypothetical protein